MHPDQHDTAIDDAERNRQFVSGFAGRTADMLRIAESSVGIAARRISFWLSG